MWVRQTEPWASCTACRTARKERRIKVAPFFSKLPKEKSNKKQIMVGNNGKFFKFFQITTKWVITLKNK